MLFWQFMLVALMLTNEIILHGGTTFLHENVHQQDHHKTAVVSHMVWCNMHPGKGQTFITQTGNTTAGSKSDMRPFLLKCLSSVVQRSSWRFLLTDKLRLHLVSVQKSWMQVGNMYQVLNMMIVTIHLIHSVQIPAGTICHSCFLLQKTFFSESSQNQNQICFPSRFI